jgi:hypothetical protein
MDRLFQVERFHKGGKVVGIGVHIVAVPRLARPAVTPAVMGYTAVAPTGQKEHLILEGVGRERPTVAEDNGLPGAPVLVVDLRAVVYGSCGHMVPPFFFCGKAWISLGLRLTGPQRNVCRALFIEHFLIGRIKSWMDTLSTKPDQGTQQDAGRNKKNYEQS